MSVPVLLLHDAWCTAANWERTIAVLSPRGYRCFAPTLPAHEATADQPLRVRGVGLAEYRQAVLSAVRAQHWEQAPIVIGHSLGALLAQQLAAELRPLALVLLAPLAPAGISAISPLRLAALLPWLSAGLRGGAYRPGFETASQRLFNSVAVERRRGLHESLVHESGRCALQLGLLPLFGARTAAVDTAGISCPVYIVSGGRDRLVSSALVRRLAQHYRGATLRHYPERGHWLIDDDETEEMLHGLCSWLRPLERRAESQTLRR